MNIKKPKKIKFKKFKDNHLNIERFCSLISLTISTFSPKIKINNPMATIGTKIPAPIR
jgi:hypothetical protein